MTSKLRYNPLPLTLYPSAPPILNTPSLLYHNMLGISNIRGVGGLMLAVGDYWSSASPAIQQPCSGRYTNNYLPEVEFFPL